MIGSSLLRTAYNVAFISFFACIVVRRHWECTDVLLITGLLSHCAVLAAEISTFGMCSVMDQFISVFNFFLGYNTQQLKCRASLAWEPSLLCLCTQAIASHTGRASRWVLSNSYWFHGTLVCLLHQLRAHQLCTTGFGPDWLPGFSAYLICIFAALSPNSLTCSR